MLYFLIYSWVGENTQHDNCNFFYLHPPNKCKIYKMTILLIVFSLYIYMAREGIEQLLNITDGRLTFKLDRLHIQHVLYNRCIVNNVYIF